MEPHERNLLARTTELAGLVEAESKRLNGRYRFTLTGSIVTVSDGIDWSQKVVTTHYGLEKTEPSIVIVEAIKKGWYVPIAAPTTAGGEGAGNG